MLGVAATLAGAALGAVLLDRAADLREAAAEARYPPTGKLLQVGGRCVHAHVEGTGPDLILLHGASGNTRDFTFSLVSQLAARYRVIAFDRPGLGWTERTKDHYDSARNTGAESPAEQAALLQVAADQLGAQNPIVLGHSYGGSVAMAWALARPQDTAALVILSGATQPWPGGLGPFYTVVSSTLGGATVVPLITAWQPYTRLDATLSSIFGPDPVPDGYARYIGAGMTLRRNSFRANARQLTTLRPHVVEMAPRYPSLSLPVEILHGTADDVVPLHIHAAPLAEQLPNARLTSLDGIGHMPHHAAEDKVIAAIDAVARRAQLHPAS